MRQSIRLMLSVLLIGILAGALAACNRRVVVSGATIAAVTPVVSPSASLATPTDTLAQPAEATPTLLPTVTAKPVASPTSVSATPTSTTAALKPCRIVDLQAISGFQGATGSLAGGGTFTNRSAQACTLGGRPMVEILDGQGHPLPITYRATNDTGLPLILQPGQHAGSLMTWWNWCGQTPPFPLTMRIRLPGDPGQITIPMQAAGGVPLNDVPRCDVPGETSTFSVGTIGDVYSEPEPTPIPPPPPGGTPTLQPGRVPACNPTDFVAHATWTRNGQVLEGHIVMTNIASTTCTLTAPYFEHIAVLDAAGKPVPVTSGFIPRPPGTGKLPTLVVQPLSPVTVAFTWKNWCSLELPGPFALRLRFYGNPASFAAPVSGSGSTPADALPACQDPSQHSSLEWSNFELGGMP